MKTIKYNVYPYYKCINKNVFGGTNYTFTSKLGVRYVFESYISKKNMMFINFYKDTDCLHESNQLDKTPYTILNTINNIVLELIEQNHPSEIILSVIPLTRYLKYDIMKAKQKYNLYLKYITNKLSNKQNIFLEEETIIIKLT